MRALRPRVLCGAASTAAPSCLPLTGSAREVVGARPCPPDRTRPVVALRRVRWRELVPAGAGSTPSPTVAPSPAAASGEAEPSAVASAFSLRSVPLVPVALRPPRPRPPRRRDRVRVEGPSGLSAPLVPVSSAAASTTSVPDDSESSDATALGLSPSAAGAAPAEVDRLRPRPPLRLRRRAGGFAPAEPSAASGACAGPPPAAGTPEAVESGCASSYWARTASAPSSPSADTEASSEPAAARPVPERDRDRRRRGGRGAPAPCPSASGESGATATGAWSSLAEGSVTGAVLPAESSPRGSPPSSVVPAGRCPPPPRPRPRPPRLRRRGRGPELPSAPDASSVDWLPSPERCSDWAMVAADAPRSGAWSAPGSTARSGSSAMNGLPSLGEPGREEENGREIPFRTGGRGPRPAARAAPDELSPDAWMHRRLFLRGRRTCEGRCSGRGPATRPRRGARRRRRAAWVRSAWAHDPLPCPARRHTCLRRPRGIRGRPVCRDQHSKAGPRVLAARAVKNKPAQADAPIG